MSDLGFTSKVTSKFVTIEVISHSSTEGGDVCALEVGGKIYSLKNCDSMFTIFFFFKYFWGLSFCLYDSVSKE